LHETLNARTPAVRQLADRVSPYTLVTITGRALERKGMSVA
jgi:hypothetical protein